MTVRSRFFMSAVAGLWMALPLAAQVPGRINLDKNQGFARAESTMAGAPDAGHKRGIIFGNKGVISEGAPIDMGVPSHGINGHHGIPNYIPQGSPHMGEGAGQVSSEPMPIYQAPIPGQYDLTGPRLPPYAWPTYAPYDNFSRVAYPEAYPYQAWPFIGPLYPFPKVPLSWRAVKLEWQDGHWWYSKVAQKYDWWRIRYW